MKKIFAYIGSAKGKSSFTYNFTKTILEDVKRLDMQNEILYEIYTANDFDIKFCKSCNKCFESGWCPNDRVDDMKLIKQKMMDADFVILGSPVFAHQVSGNMKVVIDRLSYWLHLFKLGGKYGATVSTSSGNGNYQVNAYLYKMMNHMGIKVAGNFNCIFEDLTETNEDKLSGKIRDCALNIYSTLTGEKNIKATEFQEKTFEIFKDLYSDRSGGRTAEHIFWEENGYFECNNFEELFTALHKRRYLKYENK